MRIVYGVQSTGRGHLARFAALKPWFDADGHEMLVIISGRHDPPSFFLDAVGTSRHERMSGFEMADDGMGGISKRKTASSFVGGMPGLLKSLRQGHKLITQFAPDFIISDFDPITGSPLVAPSVFKVGVGNWAMSRRHHLSPLPGERLDRFNTNLAIKLCSSGVDVILSCHFYPHDSSCLPPILRPEIEQLSPSDDGHVLVYHSFPGRLDPILSYAERHQEREILIYGYNQPSPGTPANVHFVSEAGRFLQDLTSCYAYVGTAGFQTICEAFFLGKRIVVQPIEGHYEQKWNAAQLETLHMGRRLHGSLEAALAHPFNRRLHEQLVPWYQQGTQLSYTRIMECAAQALGRG